MLLYLAYGGVVVFSDVGGNIFFFYNSDKAFCITIGLRTADSHFSRHKYHSGLNTALKDKFRCLILSAVIGDHSLYRKLPLMILWQHLTMEHCNSYLRYLIDVQEPKIGVAIHHGMKINPANV